jgi:hypothetical protein
MAPRILPRPVAGREWPECNEVRVSSSSRLGTHSQFLHRTIVQGRFFRSLLINPARNPSIFRRRFPILQPRPISCPRAANGCTKSSMTGRGLIQRAAKGAASSWHWKGSMARQTIMKSICSLLLISAMPLLKIEASLAQELSVEDRACITSAVAKLPQVAARSREAVPSRAVT